MRLAHNMGEKAGSIDQARLAWRNLDAQLKAAEMGLDNLVKVTIFLSDRRYALENRRAPAGNIGRKKPGFDGYHNVYF